MFDIEKVADALLKIVSEPIARLTARVKAVEERKLPDEKQIVEAVMEGIDPVLAALGKKLDEMRDAFLADVKAARDAIAELPETSEVVRQVHEQLAPSTEEFKKGLSAIEKSFASIEIPTLPDIPAMINEVVRELVDKKFAEYPVPKDGHSVTVEEVTPMIEGLVDRATTSLRQAIDDEIGKAVANIPQVKDGEPGKSVTIEEVTPVLEQFVRRVTDPIPVMITEKVAEAVSKIPAAKDGAGLMGAVIDRNNHLVMTLSDGKSIDVGPVVGKDADMKELTQTLRQLVDDIPKPRDGFGFEDLSVEYDGQRSFSLKFVRGADSEEFKFKLPVMIYKNVYQPGASYEQGDVVTWAGAMWHCDKNTDTKPGDGNDNWTLAVKRGRNAKEVVPVGPKKSPIVKV